MICTSPRSVPHRDLYLTAICTSPWSAYFTVICILHRDLYASPWSVHHHDVPHHDVPHHDVLHRDLYAWPCVCVSWLSVTAVSRCRHSTGPAWCASRHLLASTAALRRRRPTSGACSMPRHTSHFHWQTLISRSMSFTTLCSSFLHDICHTADTSSSCGYVLDCTGSSVWEKSLQELNQTKRCVVKRGTSR